MHQRSTWARAAAGLAVAALMIGATVAIAQVSNEFVQDRLIRISPEEGSEELEVKPFPGEDAIEAPKHWIGLMAGPVPELLRKHLRLGENEGVLVLSVVEDSPAAKAGIVKDDLILAAAGKELEQARDLVELVRERGQEAFDLEIIHEGERSTVNVTPAERPEEYAVVPFQENQEGNAWRIVPDDMPQVRKWLQQLPHGGEGLDFRAIGPGMLFDGRDFQRQNFPSGLSVQIQKQGDEPAKVKVQQGDETWEFEADDKESLEQLPEDVRNTVEGMLGGRGATFSLQGGDVLRQLGAQMPEVGGELGSDLEQRMKAMESRIEQLVDELERLRSEE